MSTSLSGAVRILSVRKGESIKSIYAKVKKAFSAEDLERYAEVENGISAEELLARLEANERKEVRKPRKLPRKA